MCVCVYVYTYNQRRGRATFRDANIGLIIARMRVSEAVFTSILLYINAEVKQISNNNNEWGDNIMRVHVGIIFMLTYGVYTPAAIYIEVYFPFCFCAHCTHTHTRTLSALVHY